MSDTRDRLRNAQRGGASDAPKLEIMYNFDVREIPSKPGNIAFSFFGAAKEGEDKQQLYTKSPITGIYIGAAMKISGFSPDLGKNGGQYFSSMYFKNSDIVTLMSSEGGQIKKHITGTPEAVQGWLGERRVNAKKHRCLYILTSAGLVKIETNVSLAINDLAKIEKDLVDNFIIATPTLYDPNDPSIIKRTKESLSKLAEKNPPKYAKLTMGNPIEEKVMADWKLDEIIDQWLKWKEYKEKTAGVTDGESASQPQNSGSRPSGVNPGTPGNPYRVPPQTMVEDQEELPGSDNEINDLPF